MWLKQASIRRDLDRQLGYNLPDSLAFPRFLPYRQLNEGKSYTWDLGKEKKGIMKTFEKAGFKVELQTSESLRNYSWSGRTCLTPYLLFSWWLQASMESSALS